MRPRLRVLTAMALHGARTALGEKFVLIFGVGYYLLFVFMLAAIWRYTPFTGRPGQIIDFTTMVWYVALTEMVTFGGTQFRELVRQDVVTGQLAGQMGMPLPYWALKMAQLLGRGLAHFIILAAAGAAAGWLLTGKMPFALDQILFVLPPLFMALLLTLAASFAIGLLDVWGSYARPVYWIWQKAVFVFGGLIMPLSLYPDWMQTIAVFTPFPSMVYYPALPALERGAASFTSVMMEQAFWLAALSALALGLHGAARRHIGKHGD